MRNLILIAALILNSSLASAYSYPRSKTKIPTDRRETPVVDTSMSAELQIGSQRTLNGPDDSSGTKVSLTFSKYFGDFSIAPQISYVFFNVSGNESFSLANQTMEAELWGKYRFWHNISFHTYAGFGVGARKDSVKTSVMGSSTSVDSEYYSIISGSVGGAWAPSSANLNDTIAGLRITLELQLHNIPSYDYQDLAILLGTGTWF